MENKIKSYDNNLFIAHWLFVWKDMKKNTMYCNFRLAMFLNCLLNCDGSDSFMHILMSSRASTISSFFYSNLIQARNQCLLHSVKKRNKQIKMTLVAYSVMTLCGFIRVHAWTTFQCDYQLNAAFAYHCVFSKKFLWWIYGTVLIIIYLSYISHNHKRFSQCDRLLISNQLHVLMLKFVLFSLFCAVY
jgi:lysylphosphatidylglycerol synthetase-like protein (DUF2156 family)